jgi:peptidoglycan hydrolase-like protein with peptidoglycan-binding domain
VQYRLKYLAYYNGQVHGVNDRLTKDAVIAFQTDQQIMIDGIPGPQTQGELVRVCGF